MRVFRAPYAPAPATSAYSPGEEYVDRQKVQRAMPTPFVEAITASRTVTPQDDSGWFLANATSGAVVLTLPLANSAPAMTLTVKKTDSSANTVSVARTGTDTIDGATSVAISAQYGAVVLRSDGGTTWNLLTPATAGTATKVGHSLSAGTHLAGGPFDGSADVTLTTDAVSTNTPGTLVARDASGNFSAGTITAALSGNASTATQVGHSLTAGTHLAGGPFDGSANVTLSTDATNANTASTIMARGALGDFAAGAATLTDVTATGNIAAQGGLVVSGNAAGVVAGAIGKNAGVGLMLVGITGAAYDASLTTPSATTVFGVITGTNTTEFGGEVTLPASTTARPSLKVHPGTAPTSPSDGDMWYDGTNVKFQVGGTTKTFTLT